MRLNEFYSISCIRSLLVIIVAVKSIQLVVIIAIKKKGASFFDKLVMNSLKFFYLFSRISLRIDIGKKRRDRIWIDKKINFSSFLYKSVENLGLDIHYY